MTIPNNDKKEIRITDSKTGAQKGTKLARFDLIPTQPHLELAEHYGKGTKKYADRNFQRGYNWSLSIAALERHLNAFKSGEDFDLCGPNCPPDCKEHTGSAHIIAVAWHAFALREFMLHHPDGDDRECRFYEKIQREREQKAQAEALSSTPSPKVGP